MSTVQSKVIINPAAGGYSVRRDWPRIERLLRNAGLVFDHEFTDGRGHAIELSTTAIEAGYRYLIVIGGDGTINEVVNGMLNSKYSSETMLGILSAGTACSFARSVGIPKDYAAASSILAAQRKRFIDVGVAEYVTNGQSAKRFFVNVADVGLGATIVDTAKSIPHEFGRSINYAPFLVAATKSLFNYENKRLNICLGNEEASDSGYALVIVANGPYYGGGMYIAPYARLDDGLLDVIIVSDVEKSELLNIWLMSYRGKHIRHPKLKVEKVSSLTIHCAEQVLVETDGECLGECPATFSVLPAGLTIVT